MTQNVKVEWNGPEAKGAMLQGAAVGLNMAAEFLRAQAIPLTPYLDGDLTESAAVHTVEATQSSVAQGSQVQFDTVYAVDQHENLTYDHTRDPHPQAQAKYLETPALRHSKTIGGIVSKQIQRRLE